MQKKICQVITKWVLSPQAIIQKECRGKHRTVSDRTRTKVLHPAIQIQRRRVGMSGILRREYFAEIFPGMIEVVGNKKCVIIPDKIIPQRIGKNQRREDQQNRYERFLAKTHD